MTAAEIYRAWVILTQAGCKVQKFAEVYGKALDKERKEKEATKPA